MKKFKIFAAVLLTLSIAFAGCVKETIKEPVVVEPEDPNPEVTVAWLGYIKDVTQITLTDDNDVEYTAEVKDGFTVGITAIPESVSLVEVTYNGADMTIPEEFWSYDSGVLVISLNHLVIADAAQLKAIADDLAGNYILTADIDLNNELWVPIGTSSKPFTGSLEGNGHEISNLKINQADYSEDVLDAQRDWGLFGAVKNATLKNIILESGSVAVEGGGGGICGRSTDSYIENCVNRASVTILEDSENAMYPTMHGAGISASNSGGRIVNCINHGDIIKTSALSGAQGYLGGIAGINTLSGKIEGCVNNGKIAGAEKSSYIGGIAGSSTGLAYAADALLDNCINNGEVSGYQWVGGIVGNNLMSRGTISNCKNTGTVTGVSTWIGGIAGSNSGLVTRSTNSGAVNGLPVPGGIATIVGGIIGLNSTGGQVTACINTAPVSTEAPGGGWIGGVGGLNYGYINSCANQGGAITLTGAGSYYIGGVIGYNEKESAGTYYDGQIIYSYSTGSVNQANGYYAGGVCGANKYMISTCYSAADITASLYAGGVCGSSQGSTASIASSYFKGTLTATNYVGGVCGYISSSSKVNAVYNIGKVKLPDGTNSGIGALVGYNSASTITNSYWGGESSAMPAVGSGGLGTSGSAALFSETAWPVSTTSGWGINARSGPWKTLNEWTGGGEDQKYPVLIMEP